MWRRFNRQTERAIGNPTLIETSLDEKSLEGLTNLNNGAFSISSRPAFGRKATEDVLKGLPELPLPLEERPYSHAPTASSVYSQPSPDMQQQEMPSKLTIPRNAFLSPEGISPPDSPCTNDGATPLRGSPNISPVTESTPSSIVPLQPSQKHASNIPMRRASLGKGATGTSLYGWKEKLAKVSSPDKLRWDDYSGEPSEAGKPQQTTPSTARYDFEHAHGRNSPGMGNPAQPSSGQRGKNILTYKAKKKGRRESSEVMAERPEWKGASGRTTIVKPLIDKPLPSGKNATFPPGKNHILDALDLQTLGNEFENLGLGLKVKTTSEEHLPALVEFDESIKPTPPLKVGRNSPQSPLSSPNTQGPPSDRRPSFDGRSPLARNPSNEELQEKPSVNSSNLTPRNSRDNESPKPTEDDFRSKMHHMHLEGQLPSRFSATTYATTAVDSPPATPRMSSDAPPPIPTPPLSVLNRKRPVPVAGVPSNKVMTRKPTPSQVEITSKSLPKSPPENEAVDRVSSLQANLDNLHRRRANLQTVIHELTHVIQPSSIAYDMASRQEIKRTVTGLNWELAEVTKEEHETGLKLHRAMKRQDDNGMFEPTGLWVRRVTG